MIMKNVSEPLESESTSSLLDGSKAQNSEGRGC